MQIDEPSTAFGELQTAELSPLFQITHPYGINLDLVTTASNGGAAVTYNSVNRVIQIASDGINTSASLRSAKPAKYRNGQGMNVRFTTIFGTPTVGSMQMAGWGDATEGFFFAYSGSNFGIIRQRSGSAVEFISQSSWNIDRMDGSSNSFNPSGQLLNPQLGNVYEIQAQWLGYGAIQYFIESKDTGRFAPVHLIKYANTSTTASIGNPTNPIIFRVENTTASSPVTMSNASMAAFVEGKIIFNGVNYSSDGSPGATANKNMLTLFNPSTFNGYTNKTSLLLKTLTVLTDGNNAITFNIVKNGTLTGTVFNTVNVNSPSQIDIAATYTAGTGRSAYKTILNKVDSKTIDISSYEIFCQPGETISIIATGGANTGALVSLSWLDDV